MPKHLGYCFFTVALVLAGCASSPTRLPTSDRLDVAEVVVRSLFSSVGPNRIAAICFPKLSDPSRRFLNRLSPLPVAPCSSLKENRPGTISVIEATGQRAVTIYIERFEVSGPDSVTVTASHWQEALDGGGYVFVLQRTDGTWHLAKKEGTWIG